MNTIIPQKYIGEAAIAGFRAACFGAFWNPNKMEMMYLSIAGASTGIEAIWATLVQGKEVVLVPDPSLRRYQFKVSGKKGKGIYTKIQKAIPELGINHLIMYSKELIEPEYPQVDSDEAGECYSLGTTQEQAISKFGQHLRGTVAIPVYEEWFKPLYQYGMQRPQLLEKVEGLGVNGLRMYMSPDEWTNVITDMLKNGTLQFPEVQ